MKQKLINEREIDKSTITEVLTPLSIIYRISRLKVKITKTENNTKNLPDLTNNL